MGRIIKQWDAERYETHGAIVAIDSRVLYPPLLQSNGNDRSWPLAVAKRRASGPELALLIYKTGGSASVV